MAGTTIKGVGNDGNVQIRDMVTAAKQNAGTGFQQGGQAQQTTSYQQPAQPDISSESNSADDLPF